MEDKTMYNKMSLYALNKKNSDAIVYMDANGNLTYITRDDIGDDRLFLSFKSWSDENLHLEDKQDHREANHTISSESLSEAALAVPSAESCIEQKLERIERFFNNRRMVQQIQDMLTVNQFRRLWMYYVDGMTIDQIGSLEGISHQNVSKSIRQAVHKIKKHFQNG